MCTKRTKLTTSILIAGIALTGCSSPGSADNEAGDVDWPVYLGDPSSSQYSTLDQVNRDYVHRLEVAWVYRTGDIWRDGFAQIQTNPIVRDGVLYGTSPAIDVFALDAASGAELWRFDAQAHASGEHPATPYMGVSRGVALWSGGDELRLFVARESRLHALDARTGKPVRGFGHGGFVDLREGLGRDVSDTWVGATSPGIVYENLLIQGTRVGEEHGAAPGHVRAYDVTSGEIAWTFHTIPVPGEFGHDTWPADAWRTAGGANSWAGMSLDTDRGIVYVPTGSATFDFWGGKRVGANLFANSLVALDAATGKRRWHFQAVHHDIWDRDLPAPPNLLTVERDGRPVDAVAQITKSGHVFLFDRVTGEPLFAIEERPVPPSQLRGERAWPTQPFPVMPKPFARQRMTEDDINDFDPDTHDELLARFRELRNGGAFQPFDTVGTILLPGFDGGGEWGGAATDPGGVLYVNASEMPWIATLADVEAATAVDASMSLGEATYMRHCAICHGRDRSGGQGWRSPSLLAIAPRHTEASLQTILEQGSGFMPAFRHIGDAARDALIAWLLGLPEAENVGAAVVEQAAPAEIPYQWTGYVRFVDANGYPAIKPPWGTLSAIDLNTGEYRWQVPLGELPELTAKGISPTGVENYGGPIVTAGGLVFIAATKDAMFRAFDKDTGELLWETKLPTAGFATPSTYSVDGRQYVVIAAGGGKLGQPSGDAYVAFALPASTD